MMHGGLFEPHDELVVVKQLDLVVSGLMHLLIISSNAGTPVVAIHGQAKHTQLIADLYGDEIGRLNATILLLEFYPAAAHIFGFASTGKSTTP